MNQKIWSISQLVAYIKQQLANDFILHNISVQGEIGNFTNHFSGHWYFTLKDSGALINCAMFKGYNSVLDFIPKNGDTVIVNGSVNIFEKSGQMQIVVTHMKQSGEGDFYAQFEKTRKKLEPLGYFDISRKKPIPQYPTSISVVTGANTAALQDVRITLARRWPVELREVYATVQGKEAIESVVEGLKTADSQHSDVIILARGGGSVDDLWCFNDEKIAQAIFNCKTPVITGIGHEIDTTIADLVADKRAATPTAAAVAATPDIKEVRQNVANMQYTLEKIMESHLNQAAQITDYQTNRLLQFTNRITDTQTRVSNCKHIISLSLVKSVETVRQRIISNKENLTSGLQMLYQKKEHQYQRENLLLDSLSPLKTLSRGYIISQQNDKIIKSVKDIDKKKNIVLTYADGSVEVKSVEE